MADARTASFSFAPLRAALRRIADLPERNIRLTVILCVVAIAGSFAAAGSLQMRFDRVQAFRQAVYYDQLRAADLAAYADASLSRFADTALVFANGGLAEEATAALPGIRGIAVSDVEGLSYRKSGETIDMFALAPLTRTGRVLTGNEQRLTLAFRDLDRLIAVTIDPSAIAPPSLLAKAAIYSETGALLTGSVGERQSVVAHAPHWPLRVQAEIEEEGALTAWYGSLPLYLFVILGPALVGAWLAVMMVRLFERHAKAARAIRALRSTHPAEARLLVRLAAAERHGVEAMRAKNEFIAHMSHELRTPLNAIIGFSEVIERGFFGPPGHAKYGEYARDIGAAGRSLHERIGDILEYANIEAGRHPLHPVPCDAYAIAAACVSEQAGRAFSRRIRLDLMPVPAATIRADEAAVKRILASLLTNALTYTPEGGRVLVTVAEEEAAVAICVSDTGAGIPRHQMNRIGTPFVSFARDNVSTGTGLGLAIVIELARRMGGAVKLVSAHGEGLSAELRLPKA